MIFSTALPSASQPSAHKLSHTITSKEIGKGWGRIRTRARVHTHTHTNTHTHTAVRAWATRRGLCSRRVSLTSASPPSGSAFTLSHTRTHTPVLLPHFGTPHTNIFLCHTRTHGTHTRLSHHVLACAYSCTPLRCVRAEIAFARARLRGGRWTATAGC